MRIGAAPENSAALNRVIIHTDGGCKGNPGPGGYGAVLVAGPHRKEISAGFRRTTNNRMELRAAIAALELLKQPCDIELHSDSRYLVDAMTKNWIDGWRRRGWTTSAKSPVKNKDLWMRLVAATTPHRIEWRWVKGHAGQRENERCDVLANLAVSSGNLEDDQGFSEADAVD